MAIIHTLLAGQPLCGFTTALVVDWPDGHLWMGLEVICVSPELLGDNTLCTKCQEIAAEKYPYED